MNTLSLGTILLAGLLGLSSPRVVQISTGQIFTCALLDDGAVKCWGGNRDIQARGDIRVASEIPANIPRIDLGRDASGAYRPVAEIATSWLHACAIMADDRSVKCWGDLNEGRTRVFIGGRTENMGNALAAIRLGPGARARSLSISTYSSCAVLEDDTLKCWGRNTSGSLGQGDTEPRASYDTTRAEIPPINLGSGVTVRKAAMGENHTCALIDQGENEGKVKCWGQNTNGYLGLGDNESRGATPESMGDNLPEVNLGEGRHAVDLQAGYYHTCALLDDHSIKCWGLNSNGQLGIGRDVNFNTPPFQAVNLGRGVTPTRLIVGGFHTCAILANQTMKCWGRGTNGELGQAPLIDRGRRAEEMGDALRPINLGRGHAVESASLTNVHGCALLAGGRVKCWGTNGEAQLGLGDTRPRLLPHELGDALPFLDFGLRGSP